MIRRLALTLSLALTLGACATTPSTSAELTHEERIEAALVKPQVGGYCPVAYVDANSPVKGRPEHAVTTQDGVFWFVNADAEAAYIKNSGRYQIPFLNYDPVALASGEVRYADPTVYAVYSGKIYLFADVASRDAFISDAENTIIGAHTFFATFE